MGKTLGSVQAVRQEVERMLRERWPDWTVYHERRPDGAVGPDFLIQTPCVTQKGAGADTVSVALTLAVFCRVKAGEEETGAEELAGIRDQVMELVRPGFLRVGDRAMRCDSCKGTIEQTFAKVEMQLNYWEDRSPREERDPAMGTVTINMKEEL